MSNWPHVAVERQLIIVAALLAVACTARHPLAPDRSPDWLTSLIHQLEAQAVANPPALIAQYDYRGDVVYYLPARCCDIPSTLYQADGAILCHPDGGLAGKGDGRCPAFFAERRNERIVWRDPRAAP